MYHSTLNQREHAIEADSFKDAPNLVFNYFAAHETPDDYSVSLWERFVPYTPAQVYDLFAGGYERDDVTLNVNAYETGRLELEINGDEGFFSRLYLRVGDVPAILKSKVEVEPEAQGRGIGRTCMRNWIETSAAFGFDDFSFDAAMHDGGYVWAKMGAHLDRDQWRNPGYDRDEAELSLCLSARLEAVRPYIGHANYTEASALCRVENANDLVRLADMGDIVVPRGVLDEAAPAMGRFFMDRVSSVEFVERRVKAQLKDMSDIFTNAGRGVCEYVSLPHYLQKKNEWAGVVDFSNDAQMKRVGDYLYGWRTMAPAIQPAMA